MGLCPHHLPTSQETQQHHWPAFLTSGRLLIGEPLKVLALVLVWAAEGTWAWNWSRWWKMAGTCDKALLGLAFVACFLNFFPPRGNCGLL